MHTKLREFQGALLVAIVLLTAMPVPRALAVDGPVRTWTARWISAPDAPPLEYGVYRFRRAFDLAEKPSSFVVHVTADNRYELFANGRRVAAGPARGDLAHWRYETIDLAPFLDRGRNVLAAVVWNYGQHAPLSQITHQTGFLLQGDAERSVDTGENWTCARDDSYTALPVLPADVRNQYYVAGPGDRVDGARHPWGWERPDFDDSAWKPARVVGGASSRGAADSHSQWMLVPREIPMMEQRPERLVSLRQAHGVEAPAAFPRERAPVSIPARSKARLLLDQSHLTTAYPELVVSGGKGAVVALRYAETLFAPGSADKGDRGEVDGKEMRGGRDVFVADGGRDRLFRPLWWRTYRYIELTAETADEPLTVEDVRGVYTGYPFERKARFDAGPAAPELGRVLDVGWRTARLCAHETYMDCPYYEQLQYVGDTRIQALVSLYASGDDRLMRNAIEQLDDSRTADGLTFSRAPTRLVQYIPPFSLWWIGMVHDYWRYRDDPEFVRGRLPGVRAVLSFFAAHERPSGSLGPVPWWNFVDWTPHWPSGVPRGRWASLPSWSQPPAGASADDLSSASSSLDLQLLLAYDWAADLEETLGSKDLARQHRASAERLRATVRSLYWDPAKQLFADTPARTAFSQQANALAIIARVTTGAEARRVMDRVLSDGSLVQASVYFRYYVNVALREVGEGDRYLDQLGPWRSMLDQGLTTWAEIADPATRSDCHAWGASPNVELFRTVLGIDSAAPGFARVAIRPSLGKLTRVSGAIPHPRGEIAVSLSLDGVKLTAEVDLPRGVEGEFVWRGESRPLAAGKNRIVF
jgi:alpha-L-rhamnosidase